MRYKFRTDMDELVNSFGIGRFPRSYWKNFCTIAGEQGFATKYSMDGRILKVGDETVDLETVYVDECLGPRDLIRHLIQATKAESDSDVCIIFHHGAFHPQPYIDPEAPESVKKSAKISDSSSTFSRSSLLTGNDSDPFESYRMIRYYTMFIGQVLIDGVPSIKQENQ